jgi:hypothetical protein
MHCLDGLRDLLQARIPKRERRQYGLGGNVLWGILRVDLATKTYHRLQLEGHCRIRHRAGRNDARSGVLQRHADVPHSFTVKYVELDESIERTHHFREAPLKAYLGLSDLRRSLR